MSDFFFDSFDDYYLLNKTKYPDGLGGYYTEWTEGEIVKMRLDLGNSAEVRQAMAQGLKTIFTASFPANTPVEYNDYLRNAETGGVFRVTSNPKDNMTPPTAKYPSCFATAERTELPK